MCRPLCAIARFTGRCTRDDESRILRPAPARVVPMECCPGRRKLVRMRRLRPFLLLLSGLVAPAFAQHGAARGGGFSAHPGGAYRAGVAPIGSSGFRGASQRFRSPVPAPRFVGHPNLTGAAGYRRGVSTARPSFYTRTREAYASGQSGARLHRSGGRDARFALGYPRQFYPGYLAYGLVDPFWAYPDSFYYETPPNSPDVASAFPDQPRDEAGPMMPMPYEAQEAQVAPARNADPLPEEEEVTVVFKDGRPSEQIRNYALTRTALVVPGAHLREIPVDEIDLPATEKVNRQAGVTFQLPQ